jgi:hypothetical protein
LTQVFLGERTLVKQQIDAGNFAAKAKFDIKHLGVGFYLDDVLLDFL